MGLDGNSLSTILSFFLLRPLKLVGTSFVEKLVRFKVQGVCNMWMMMVYRNEPRVIIYVPFEK